MKLPDFLIGRYFSRWEHSDLQFLCTADVDAYCLDEILALADEEARSQWRHVSLGYTATQGNPLLLAEISKLYDDVEPDEILTFSGGEEGIFILFNVLLQQGDHAIVVWPAYQSLYEVPRAAGAEVTFIPLIPDANWSLDIDAVQAAIRPNTRVVVVNFPHTPTGALPDRNTFIALCEIVQEAGAYLFSDESFRFLEYDVRDRLPAAIECYERGISLGSLSKAFGLAGLRIGWLATRDRNLLTHMLHLKDYTSVSNSAVSESLATIALRARTQVLKRSLDTITNNLIYLDNFFAKWSGIFTWVRPRAGNVAFPCLHYNVPVDRFAAELVEQEGVLILPGTVFEYPGGYFRIGFGRKDLPRVLEQFEHFIACRLV